MNAEQKQRAADLLSAWQATAYALHGDAMADLLQEMADAPEVKPAAWVLGYYAGYLSVATVDGRVLPTGTALYTAPPEPSVPDGWRPFLTDVVTAAGLLAHGKRDKGLADRIGKFAFAAMLAAAPTPAEPPADVAQWIDPNDKTQKQFLPHIGERVLFCHAGKTYYGKHTGGSFISFTNPGNYYPTWDCHWMYPPKAIDAAIKRQGGE